jgi:hypothetical protein
MKECKESLGKLKRHLQSAGLLLLDEAPSADVELGTCEPWINVGWDGVDWIVQADYSTREVVLMEADGTEVLRRHTVCYETLLEDVTQLIELRLGTLLIPVVGRKTADAIAAELEASAAARRVLDHLTRS